MTIPLPAISMPNLSRFTARLAPLAPIAFLATGCDENAAGLALGAALGGVAMGTANGLTSFAASAALGLHEKKRDGYTSAELASPVSPSVYLSGRNYTTLHKVLSWAGILGTMGGTFAAAHSEASNAWEILGAYALASAVTPAVTVRLIDGVRNLFGTPPEGTA